MRLTRMQNNVVNLLKNGLTNRQIGEQLNIKEKTVKFHLNNVYKKTGHKTRIALLVSIMRSENVQS